MNSKLIHQATTTLNQNQELKQRLQFLQQQNGDSFVTQLITDVSGSLDKNINIICDKLSIVDDPKVRSISSQCRRHLQNRLASLTAMTLASGMSKETNEETSKIVDVDTCLTVTCLPYDTFQAKQELEVRRFGESYTEAFKRLLQSANDQGVQNIVHLVVCIGNAVQLHVGVCVASNSPERINILPIELLSDEERSREGDLS